MLLDPHWNDTETPITAITIKGTASFCRWSPRDEESFQSKSTGKITVIYIMINFEVSLMYILWPLQFVLSPLTLVGERNLPELNINKVIIFMILISIILQTITIINIIY